ncbi:substrate-binding domain-containing protein [Cryobacterium sp. GrIS_2_6]|uniref:LacI family DNA-binding transcriptional regulator n=1 Tax=Cryobacterium sp. GrIS_2_6 TaxID=3162785 RepID=UPI002E072227|nr:DNA-binding LacI/PurR family transcriptional regulator [Cryobacterium psychrotolerans]
MDEIGYRPNSAARALESGRFSTIGVIVFTLSSVGNMRTFDAVAMLDRIDVTVPTGLPVVIVDSDAGSRYTVVDTDQTEGARLATQHLLNLGHRTVWHIAGPESSFSAGRRTASWRNTLKAAAAPVPPVLEGDWSAQSGYVHGVTLAADPLVTAIFASNDQMALGVMRAMHEAGRALPADVSVVGFDAMRESGEFWPALTTVHQDFAQVGRLCIEKLLRQIDSPRCVRSRHHDRAHAPHGARKHSPQNPLRRRSHAPRVVGG